VSTDAVTSDPEVPSGGQTPPVDDDLDTDGTEGEVDVQQRLERSRWGRIAISALIVVLMGSVLVINAPQSITKRALMIAAVPIVNVTGLDPGWAVYAPAPRMVSYYLDARILDRDGTVSVRSIPLSRGLNEYWDYRWQRYGDTLINSPGNDTRWAPYCRWVAAQERAAGRHPVTVTLRTIASQTLPPGPGPERAPWGARDFYTVGVGS
jgi:hypothetical protein